MMYEIQHVRGTYETGWNGQKKTGFYFLPLIAVRSGMTAFPMDCL